MCSLKILLIFCTILTVCYCDSGKIKHKHKHKCDLYYSHHDGDHHEKIVYVNSHDGPHDFTSAGGISAPGPTFGKPHLVGSASYPPSFSLDQPPPNGQITTGGSFSGPGQSGPSQAYGTPHGYGRSNNIKRSSISESFGAFTKMIKKLNITEMTFNKMNLKTDDCRKKFVCEADFNVKQSLVLRAAFDMLSDDSYSRYKTMKSITTIDECDRLYPNCIETIL